MNKREHIKHGMQQLWKGVCGCVCVCVCVCVCLKSVSAICLWIGMCVWVGEFLYNLVQHVCFYMTFRCICSVSYMYIVHLGVTLCPHGACCWAFAPFWMFSTHLFVLLRWHLGILCFRSENTHILRRFSVNVGRWWFTSVNVFILLPSQSGNTISSVPLCAQAVINPRLSIAPLRCFLKVNK